MQETPQERFEALFGPNALNREGLSASLREDVYMRMRYAFAAPDKDSLKAARKLFIRTFHPDPKDSIYTKDERTAVSMMIPLIFEGVTK